MAIVRDDNLLEYIKTFDIDNYGIALHGVRTQNGENPVDICKQICNTGLNLGTNYGSINGNAYGVGRISIEDDLIEEKLQDYAWGQTQVNVIVAYPPIIENSKGEKLYLGFTPFPKSGYDQDTVCSFMDHLCSELGYIPKEFILGYYVDKDNKFGNIERGEHLDYDVTINEHFKKIDDNLFEQFKDAMGGLAMLSEAYAEKDKETVEAFTSGVLGDLLPKQLINNSNEDVFGSEEKRL